jgi:large subunit ribosomal protein L21
MFVDSNTMMYAVFEDGSRQYRVSEGDRVTVDLREGEEGSRVEFNRVLLYRNGDDLRVGQPVVEGVRVVGEVVDHPSKKYVIQHYRRRKHYRRLKGHRQHHVEVRVQHILLPGQEPPPPPAPAPKPSAPPTPGAETAAPSAS